jgi:ATP-dependent DNA ligase
MSSSDHAADPASAPVSRSASGSWSTAASSIPADPREWRPQVPRPSTRARPIVDPIIEPLWEGIRVLVHAGDGKIRVIDDEGYEVGPQFAAIVDALSASIVAGQAVVDGWLTNQATRSTQGLALVLMEAPRGMGIFRATKPGPAPPVPHDRPDAVAFIAVDLLVLDGEILLDLPLLERKRLLESVIAGGDLVRTSPFVRPPLERWLPTWKAVGFTGAVLKASNSRYVPGGLADDWSVAQPLGRR